MKRTKILALACIHLACAGARSARAQTAADSASLARATAAVIADSVIAKVPDLVIWRPFDNAFDSAVAEELRAFPAVHRPAADPRHAIHIGVRSVAFEGDTARVLVQSYQQYADHGPGMAAYDSGDHFVFARDGAGWRYVYRRNWSIADFGEVRGR